MDVLISCRDHYALAYFGWRDWCVRMDQACEELFRHCANIRRLSEFTMRAYRLDISRFTRFAGASTSVTSFDRSTLQSYIEYLFSEHRLREMSAKRHVASLRSLFRWLEEERHIHEDLFRGARVRIRLLRRLPRVLSGQARDDPAASSRQQLLPPQARVAAEMLFATGIRVADLSGLRDDDIDLTAGVITIVGKREPTTSVYIPDAEIRELVMAYRRVRDERDHASELFLTNSRGGPASPQLIRRLIRTLAEHAALTRRITHRTCAGTLSPRICSRRVLTSGTSGAPARTQQHRDDGDLHARRGCCTVISRCGTASPLRQSSALSPE